MKQITDFVNQFGTSLKLDESLIIEKQGRFYLLSPKLKGSLSEGFFYVGTYLGKTRHGVFFPSFSLLGMIAARKEANKVTVNERSEWLFIVGRDLFKQGILKANGSTSKGTYTLVMDQHEESLGFGRIVHSLDGREDKHRVAIRNVSDIGDFLRREKGNK